VFLLDSAHGVPSVVVGDDEDEVGFAVGGVCDGGPGQQAGEDELFHEFSCT
jgi:hypothetical protein